MQSQFIREFVNDTYLSCDNNVIVIQKDRRVKELFDIFVKHILLLFFVVFLIRLFFSRIERKIIDIFYFNIVYFSFVIDIEIV